VVGVAVVVVVVVGVAVVVVVVVGVAVVVVVVVGVAVVVVVVVGVAVVVVVVVGVAVVVVVVVGVGEGVGHVTLIESPTHVVNISVEVLSKTLCSPVKLMVDGPQFEQDTLKLMIASVPWPEAPLAPGTSLIILTVPWMPGGMNPQLVTGMVVAPREPLETPVTWMILGS
jgi:hypothetical protein